MRKLMLLGGSRQQLVAIESAKKLGYVTVLCDYLPDNPGRYLVDKFYLVSTIDKDAVLKVAKKENIDGIVAYASDPAAPTAAYVAEKMKLPGNPYESVSILCNKEKFRNFLKAIGLNYPISISFDKKDIYFDVIKKMHFPLIIKPVDSSGSKGVSLIHNICELESAVELASSFSKTHRIIAEVYIKNAYQYIIGGDIFVIDGIIKLWGLLRCHKDKCINSLVPVGNSYPLQLSDSILNRIKHNLQRMIDCLHIRNGALNIEMIVDYNDEDWLIDIGPRNGGNMIPDLLGYIFNVDVISMTNQVAMGETVNCETSNTESYYATHVLHSDKDGQFENVEFSSEIKKYIFRKEIYVTNGDMIHYFDNATKAFGVIFMKFPNEEIMDDILSNINEHIHILLIG